MTADDLEREDVAIAAAIERDPVAGGKRLIETLARRHQITIDWREPARMPRGILGRANLSRREVLLPVFRDAAQATDQLAVGLHEVSHVLAPTCPERVPPHQRPWREGCLECERQAWSRAMELWPFTPAMFRMLRWGPKTAIGLYAAPQEAVAAAKALMQPAALEENQRRRHASQDRKAKQAAVRQSIVADRAATGYYTCATPGCGRRSTGLDREQPLCGWCLLNRRIVAQRRYRAGLTNTYP